MFTDESAWIREKLSALALPPNCQVLNIGSSDADFLKTQPHIEENVLAPLRERGCSILNMDIKSSPAVDIVADIASADLLERTKERFQLVICASLLEHVADRETAIRNIAGITESSGYILVTVPFNYPRHEDPIDTMYRPSAEGLARDFQKHFDAVVVQSEILDIRDSRYYYYRSRLPFWGYRAFRFWRIWLKRYRWKVSCVVLKRTS